MLPYDTGTCAARSSLVHQACLVAAGWFVCWVNLAQAFVYFHDRKTCVDGHV
jgi:hypothetical protein